MLIMCLILGLAAPVAHAGRSASFNVSVFVLPPPAACTLWLDTPASSKTAGQTNGIVVVELDPAAVNPNCEAVTISSNHARLPQPMNDRSSARGMQ